MKRKNKIGLYHALCGVVCEWNEYNTLQKHAYFMTYVQASELHDKLNT